MAKLSANPTTPYWLAYLQPELTTIAPAALPSHADVVIIGGGITGASVAYHLRQHHPNIQVVVLEARKLSWGATGRNGGLLWPSLNAYWAKTVDRFGVAEAKRLMAYELQCTQEVMEFIIQHGLQDEVRFAPFKDGSFYVFESQDEMDEELVELRTAQGHGFLQDSTVLSKEATSARLGTSAYCGSIHQPGVARVWAARLVHAIMRAASQIQPASNLHICEDTYVLSIQPLPGAMSASGSGSGSSLEVVRQQQRQAIGGPPRLSVHTSRGSLTAGTVVHCTNGYATSLLPELTRILRPVRNQVAVTKGPSPMGPVDAAFSARHGYIYFSRREDDRVIIGGFRDVTPELEWGVTDDGSLDARVTKGLRDYLPSHFGRPIAKTSNETAPPMASSAPVNPHAAADPAAPKGRHGGNRGLHGHSGPQIMVSAASATAVEHGADSAEVTATAASHRAAAGSCGVTSSGVQSATQVEYEMEWSGILGFTEDRFPLVGPVPGRPGEFMSAGFSGHGMTRTFSCGKAVAAMVAGAEVDCGFPKGFYTEGRGLGGAGTPSRM